MMSQDPASSIGLVESLLEGLPNPVFVKDENHLWVLLNTAFCEFMGRARSELIGKCDETSSRPMKHECSGRPMIRS